MCVTYEYPNFLRRTDTTSKTPAIKPASKDVISDVQQHSYVATFVENIQFIILSTLNL
jgi:hypothetical protein